MIRTNNEKLKMTAKRAAAYELWEILMNNTEDLSSFIDRDSMTEKEDADYVRHVREYIRRIGKILMVE